MTHDRKYLIRFKLLIVKLNHMEDALHCMTRFMQIHTDPSAGHIGIPTVTKTYFPLSNTL